MRTLLSVAVWLASACAAFWLANGDAGIADAPAEVIAQEFRISAVETGRLAIVCATPGKAVTAGSLLARLDTSVIEREIAAAEARLRQAGSEAQASVATMASDSDGVDRSFQSDVDQAARDLDEAQAERGRQQAELTALTGEIARQRKLITEGLTRATLADELEVRRKSLEALQPQWPARLEAITARHRAAQQRLQDWRNRHHALTAQISREQRIQPLRDRAAELNEALRGLRVRLQQAGIMAPADGVVTAVLARAGDVATVGVPFLLIQGSGPRELVAYVNERDGNRVAPGAPVLVRRRTPSREELSTRVTRVAPNVIPLPARFWLLPGMAQWGRQVYLELPSTAGLDAGEALDAKFLAGGPR